MYKSDMIGADIYIGEMLGELSYDVERAKKHVEACKIAYEEAHEIAIKAMVASSDAYYELSMAKFDLDKLESIDKQLRQARVGVDTAYNEWLKWHKA